MSNARYSNGTRARSLRTWLRSLGRPCWICRAMGRTGRIDYSLPPTHPWSFEVDHLVPVSLGGDVYDRDNVDATHRCCNQWRGNKTVEEVMDIARRTRGGSAGDGASKSGAGPRKKASPGTPSRVPDGPVETTRDWLA